MCSLGGGDSVWTVDVVGLNVGAVGLWGAMWTVGGGDSLRWGAVWTVDGGDSVCSVGKMIRDLYEPK